MLPRFQVLLLAASLLGLAAAFAQEPAAKEECRPLRPLPPRTTSSPNKPEVNVVCGSNSITQNFPASTPQPTEAASSSGAGYSPNSSVFVALVSGAAGVLGAFAGALASYLAARAKAKSDLELETKRLQASLVSAERLRWLQDIRQRLSTLYQQLDFQYSLLTRPVPPGQSATTQQQLDEMSAEVMAQCNMITLMLNPAKPDQAALRNALQGALRHMQHVFQQAGTGAWNRNNSEYTAFKQAAFDAMTRLGVETWKQVKSLA